MLLVLKRIVFKIRFIIFQVATGEWERQACIYFIGYLKRVIKLAPHIRKYTKSKKTMYLNYVIVNQMRLACLLKGIHSLTSLERRRTS